MRKLLLLLTFLILFMGSAYAQRTPPIRIIYRAALPAACDPASSPMVRLTVAPYTLNSCLVANTWTAYGIGDVFGPASSTDNAVVRFDGTTGKTTQNSAVIIADTTGDITGGKYNKITVTPPASGATITLIDGKVFTVANTLTFSGTDSSSVAFGSGGTVAYVGTANSWGDGIKQTFNPNATNAGINVGSQAGDPSSLANGDLWYDSTGNLLRARINGASISLSGGITNGAGNNVIPKSNGTNLVASRISDDATTIQIGSSTERAGATFSSFNTVLGDWNAQGNGVAVAIDDDNQTVTVSNADFVVNQSITGNTITPNSLVYSNSSKVLSPLVLTNGQLAIGADAGGAPVNANLTAGSGISITNGSGSITIAADGTNPLASYLAADYTNATASFTNTALSVTLTNTKKYSFVCQIFVADSIAADGFGIDFAGGSVTITNFIAGSNTALVTGTTSTLAGTFSNGTVTGVNLLTIYGSIEPSNTGTFIVRAKQSAHTAGTLTISRGSSIIFTKID